LLYLSFGIVVVWYIYYVLYLLFGIVVVWYSCRLV